MRQRSRPEHKTSWEAEAKQYNELVGDSGHYYHQHVVLPGALKLLQLKEGNAVLDLGCGQGVLARQIPKNVSYVGVDASRSLVSLAAKLDHDPHHLFIEASSTRPLKNVRKDFTHAVFILSLQNMEYPDNAIKNASAHVVQGGKVLLILNHPAFRIPRQSGWGEHENKIQYRWINRYMSFLRIPISMHPGKSHSATTVSYHSSISKISQMLYQNGLVIEKIEEWCSDRESKGKAAKTENRARAEFPLFMAILASKK